MKNFVILYFVFLCFFLQGEEKPRKVTGAFIYSGNKPLSCYITCSLSLLHETFDVRFCIFLQPKIFGNLLQQFTLKSTNNSQH